MLQRDGVMDHCSAELHDYHRYQSCVDMCTIWDEPKANHSLKVFNMWSSYPITVIEVRSSLSMTTNELAHDITVNNDNNTWSNGLNHTSNIQ